MQASALVEMVNALLRPYLHSSQGQITPETLNLILVYQNHRRYKSGRRQGQAPIELWTGEPLAGDGVALLIQHKREAAANAHGASSPLLALVPRHQGPTAPSQSPPEQAIGELSADADHAWQPTVRVAA